VSSVTLPALTEISVYFILLTVGGIC